MLAPRPSGALASCRSFQHIFLPSLRGRSHTRVGDQEQGSLVSFKWGRQVCSVLCPGSEAAPVPQSKPPQDQGPEVFVVPDFPEPWSLSPPQPFLPAWEQPPLPWTSEAGAHSVNRRPPQCRPPPPADLELGRSSSPASPRGSGFDPRLGELIGG